MVLHPGESKTLASNAWLMLCGIMGLELRVWGFGFRVLDLTFRPDHWPIKVQSNDYMLGLKFMVESSGSII